MCTVRVWLWGSVVLPPLVKGQETQPDFAQGLISIYKECSANET